MCWYSNQTKLGLLARLMLLTFHWHYMSLVWSGVKMYGLKILPDFKIIASGETVIQKHIFTLIHETISKLKLKLTCHHINHRHISFNIKSIPVHPLLWMNVVLDFICMIFAEPWSTKRKRKIQNDDVCLRRDSNQRALALQCDTLTTRLSGQITTCYQNLYSTFRSILQEICVVCKWYIENQNKRTLFTYSFVIDTIQIRVDLYKRRNLLCLKCQWLYIICILFQLLLSILSAS